MNRKSLMISTMLMSAMGVGGVVGFAGSAWAQCATEDCATLGYTEAYNSSGNCLKCPFGEAYNCEAGYICPEGYDYTCNGENMVAVGEACNGKYISCKCASGYTWKDGACAKLPWGTCTGLAANCSLGNILFSDGTCSANKVSGKTPIAVVVYKSSDGKCGQALALNSLSRTYTWGGYSTDISTLTNYSSVSAASKDYDSCGNSKKIMAAGNKSKYPAVWAAHEYKTAGTEAGDWCLPAAGIFTSYYNNQSVINTGFSRAGGTKFTTSTYAWSSSEGNSSYAWYSCFTNEYGLGNRIKYDSGEVRPVIEF